MDYNVLETSELKMQLSGRAVERKKQLPWRPPVPILPWTLRGVWDEQDLKHELLPRDCTLACLEDQESSSPHDL